MCTHSLGMLTVLKGRGRAGEVAGQLEEAAKARWYQALNIRETGGKRTEKSMNGNAVLSLNMS